MKYLLHTRRDLHNVKDGDLHIDMLVAEHKYSKKKLHRHFWRQLERLCGPATTRLLAVNINERDFWRQFLHVLNHKCSSHQLTENRFCR